MANTPSSLTAPKRFLNARRMRKRLPLSPSKYSTASTMCSSTRGPAMPPSLVTWPTRNTLVPVSLAKRTRRAALSRTWLTEPGAAVSCSDHSVWMESATISLRLGRHGQREDLLDPGFGQRVQAVQRQPQPHRATGDLRQTFLAGDVQAPAVARPWPPAPAAASVDLPMPGIAADQHHRAFDQAAAEHAVELADAGGDAHFRASG